MEDAETPPVQIARIRARLAIGYVVFLHDRDMIVKPRLGGLEAVSCGWVTAVRAAEIQKLRGEGSFQPGLFDRQGSDLGGARDALVAGFPGPVVATFPYSGA